MVDQRLSSLLWWMSRILFSVLSSLGNNATVGDPGRFGTDWHFLTGESGFEFLQMGGASIWLWRQTVHYLLLIGDWVGERWLGYSDFHSVLSLYLLSRVRNDIV